MSSQNRQFRQPNESPREVQVKTQHNGFTFLYYRASYPEESVTNITANILQQHPKRFLLDRIAIARGSRAYWHICANKLSGLCRASLDHSALDISRSYQCICDIKATNANVRHRR